MNKTTHLGLNLPLGTEASDLAPLNENFSKLDGEVFSRVRAVNGVQADASGNAQVQTVPFANSLVTDEQETVSGAFGIRLTAGGGSISTGEGMLAALYGRSEHTGTTQEQLSMTVHNATRPAGTDGITAKIDRDAFVSYVGEPDSTTVTMEYDGGWTSEPSWYGVTVTGVPIDGDSITVVYARAMRGTITQSVPTGFTATGWNLYNNTNGYARVAKYSDTDGYLIDGNFTSIQYSKELNGTRRSITVVSGGFNVEDDGYVWVAGGDNSTTFILPTRDDWKHGYQGEWKAYEEKHIDLQSVMSNCFPYGLCQAGTVRDEINLMTQKAIRRVERVMYSASTIQTLEANGTAYDEDEDYIYYALDKPIVTAIEVDAAYTANMHGMEIAEWEGVAPEVLTLYGQSLTEKVDQISLKVDQMILKTSSAIQIPTDSKTYSMSGITAAHEVLRWNFSVSAENSPPCDLTIVTADGQFTVTNGGGETTETIQPVFGIPSLVAAEIVNAQ